MNAIKNILVSAIVFGVIGAAVAAPVVDQNSPSATVYMAGFNQRDLAQSFKQSAANISGAGIFLQANVGVSDTVTISLFDNLPNAGGTLLASGSGIGTQGSWLDVFWADVAISAETTYFLVFTGSNNTLGIAGDVSNPYSRGQVYANTGFGSFPGFDYAFRTYADNGATTVPEPTSLGLIGVALLGVYAAARRRSHQV